MHWDDLKFWIVAAGFFVMVLFYVSKAQENARLYDVVEGSLGLASDCVNHQQARIDTLVVETNAALTGRSTDR